MAARPRYRHRRLPRARPSSKTVTGCSGFAAAAPPFWRCWRGDHSELCTSFRRPKPKILHIFEKFCLGLNTFYISCPRFADQCAKAHISPSTTQSSAKRSFKAYAWRECFRRMPLQAICLSRLFASPGYFPLQAICPSRPTPDTTSRGLILRVDLMEA